MRALLRCLVVVIPFVVAQVAAAQPSITSITPSSVVAGSIPFTLTVTGEGFLPPSFAFAGPPFSSPRSQVLWNGSLRTTFFSSSTELQALITADDVALPGTAAVVVINPGLETSNTAIFTITTGSPVPAINFISPATVTAGGVAFSLTVNGSGFVSGSVVRWNGSDRATTFVSASRLQASITDADIANTGTAEISVFTPLPGGGGSGVLTFSIIANGPPKLDVQPPALLLQVGSGSPTPATQTMRVGNSGGGFLSWTAQVSTTRGANWLTISESSGSAAGLLPSLVQVSARAMGLANGFYSGSITVTGGGSTQTVAVTLFVVPAAPILQVSNTGLRFTAPQGGVAAPTQNFAIINAGPSTLTWNLQIASGSSWLSVSPDSGSATAESPSTVTVSVNPSGLTAGSYYGEIRVLSGAVSAPQSIIMVLTIGGTPETLVNPLGLLFVARAGGAAPLAQTIKISGSTVLNMTATASTTGGGSWLSIQPSGISVPAGGQGSITVRASNGALPPGIYHGSVALAFSDNTTQVVNTALVVSTAAVASPQKASRIAIGGAAAGCVPLRLVAVARLLGGGFTSPVGWPRAIEVQTVDDCGNPAIAATVVASFKNGDAPLVLAGIGNGLYSGTWRPATAVDQTTVTIRATMAGLQEATLQVGGKVGVNPGVPLVGSSGIVNAASFAKAQPVAPGGIVSVFGVGMASATPGVASSLPLPTSLAGATLVVGGINAPLFYSSSGQINAQIPFELPSKTRLGAFVQLNLPGSIALSLPETIDLDTTRPGIFLAGQSQGVVIDVQGRLVDASAPAAAGDVVIIYSTGLGTTVPTAGTGRPAPSDPPARVTTTVTATVGGVATEVQFAGLTPGLVGLYQVNVKLPPGVPAGPAVPLVITQEGVPSNTVTFAMR